MEKNTFGWKIPIPTNITYDERFTALDRAILREILSLCQRTDTVVNFTHAKREYSCNLKRGQCIFKADNFAKSMKIDRRRVRKSIERLSEWYSRMDIKGMPYGLIVTVFSYDDLTSMDNGMYNSGTIAVQQKYNSGTANRERKSVESVKSEENISKDIGVKTPKPKIEEFGNKRVNHMGEAMELILGYKLDTSDKRRTLSNICVMLEKFDSRKRVKDGREWMEDEWKLNARAWVSWFEEKYGAKSGEVTFQSWRSIYDKFKLWHSNTGFKKINLDK